MKLLGRMSKNDIQFVVYLPGDYEQSFKYLLYWLPRLLKLDIGFAILVRNIDFYNRLRSELGNLRTYYAGSPLEVEAIFKSCPKLTTITYLSNFAVNIHSQRFNEYRHVFLGNRNTDFYSIPSNLYRVYDSIFITGNFSYRKFEKVGMTSLGIHMPMVGLPVQHNNLVDDRVVKLVVGDECLVRRNFLKIVSALIASKCYEVFQIEFVNKKARSLAGDLKEFAMAFNIDIEILDGQRCRSAGLIISDIDKFTSKNLCAHSPALYLSGNKNRIAPSTVPIFFDSIPLSLLNSDGRFLERDVSAALEEVDIGVWNKFWSDNFEDCSFDSVFKAELNQ
ncbi:hypothetical protein [uncultured Microbulbifer sp.]|uniref:hypothetical protein n=1 Tax=uncultured Microbulbifer sp. TaxID=348147 RepID=UPI0026307F58|nr:hypothetical protein [uncultured Microbulbifer sp.]